MNETKTTTKTKLFVLLGILLIAVVIIVIATRNNNQKTNAPVGGDGATQPGTTTASTTVADVAAVIAETPVAPVTATQPLKDVKIIVPGANPVTADNKVVTATGVVTDAAALTRDANAPRATAFLDEATLPTAITKISFSATGISPKEITTKAGAPTSVAVTNDDAVVHNFVFTDKVLGAIAVPVGPGQTRAIVFNAPAAGTYEYKCSNPRHADRNEVGKMIVK